MEYAQAKKGRERRDGTDQRKQRLRPNCTKLRNLGHDPRIEGNRIKCSICASSVRKSNVAKWCEQGRCEPWFSFQHSRIHVGKQAIHDSHTIARYRGITWCWKCGLVGQNKLQGLALECKSVRDRGARN